MTWDFAEANPLGLGGNFAEHVDRWQRVIDEVLCSRRRSCDVSLTPRQPLASAKSPFVSTDPPYYDNIGYADLSDFFYVWLRRSLGQVIPLAFSHRPDTEDTRIDRRLHIGTAAVAKSSGFFEDGSWQGVSAECAKCKILTFPFTVFYAFKQAETEDDEDDEDVGNRIDMASTGWETMLTGLIRSGFGITGTWPMRTEVGNRMRRKRYECLASSIVLVCRPRPDNASLATRKEFITALRRELPEALAESATGKHRAGRSCTSGDWAGDGGLYPLCQSH